MVSCDKSSVAPASLATEKAKGVAETTGEAMSSNNLSLIFMINAIFVK